MLDSNPANATSMRERPRTVAEAFVRSVALFGNRSAIQPLDGPPITYAELAGRVAVAVQVLRDLGCRPGDRIAVWLPNRPEWPVLLYAAALSGLCVVPINTRYRTAELEHALRLSEPKLLFTQERFLTNPFLDRLLELADGRLGRNGFAQITKVPTLERIVLLDDREIDGALNYRALSKHAVPVELGSLAEERLPTDPLWLFWTSGTTSAPKGALLPQSAIDNVWNWTTMAGYRADDRVLMSRPLFYIAGNFWCMLGPMLHGATAVVAQLFTADEMISLCRTERVTVLSGNPLLLKGLVEAPNFDAGAFAHVRLGYFGGSSVSFSDLKRIHDSIGFECLLQTYGMTELGGFVLSTRPGDPLELTHATCGYPMPGLQWRLVDPDTGRETRRGEPGLLVTKGQPLIDYVGVSAEDRNKLFDPEGWFRTGDLLRQREDGRFEFVGRVKDLIKVGGENVTAGEIESILMSHPQIKQAAVVPISDPTRGERPAAFIETADDGELTHSELENWCRRRMAPYKVPATFRTVRCGEWPMTATGKIAKHQLSRLLA